MRSPVDEEVCACMCAHACVLACMFVATNMTNTTGSYELPASSFLDSQMCARLLNLQLRCMC